MATGQPAIRSYRCTYFPKDAAGIPQASDSGNLPSIQLQAPSAARAEQLASATVNGLVASVERIEVVELSDTDSGFALLDHFGIADFAETQPAELSLQPLEPEPKTFTEEIKRARWSSGHSRYDELMFGQVQS